MAKKSLVDDVLERVKDSRPGFASWFDRLPPDAQQELDVTRQAFDPTKHQQRAYARAIIDAAQRRGWDIAGIQGVVAWLKKRS